jgi:hypothetical protein
VLHRGQAFFGPFRERRCFIPIHSGHRRVIFAPGEISPEPGGGTRLTRGINELPHGVSPGELLAVLHEGMLPIGGGLVLISLICTIINLIIWIFYLQWSSAIGFQSATEALRRPFMIFIIIALGHAFPILLLLLFQIQLYIGMEKTFSGTFAMVSGLAVIVGVTAQKAGIVLSSGYIRKIALKF